MYPLAVQDHYMQGLSSGSAELVIQRRIVIHRRIVYMFIDERNGVIWAQFGSFWWKLFLP